MRLRLELVGSIERFRKTQESIEALSALVADQVQVIHGAAMQGEVMALGKEVESLLGRLGAESTRGVDLDYVEFEHRFRGASADIVEGQKRYLSLFPPPGAPGPIVDIGCGSGEMLELLAKEGHECIGIDTDPGMVAGVRGEGAHRGTGRRSPLPGPGQAGLDEGIFCAQVVEHLLTTETRGACPPFLQGLADKWRTRHGDDQSSQLVRSWQPLLRRHLPRAPGPPGDAAVHLRAARLPRRADGGTFAPSGAGPGRRSAR